jgi:hypothetical protein
MHKHLLRVAQNHDVKLDLFLSDGSRHSVKGKGPSWTILEILRQIVQNDHELEVRKFIILSTLHTGQKVPEAHFHDDNWLIETKEERVFGYRRPLTAEYVEVQKIIQCYLDPNSLLITLDFLGQGHRCAKCHKQAETVCQRCQQGAHETLCWHCENICVVCNSFTTEDNICHCLGCGIAGHKSCTTSENRPVLQAKEFLCSECASSFFLCGGCHFLFCKDSTFDFHCNKCQRSFCPCTPTQGDGDMCKECHAEMFHCPVCKQRIANGTEKCFHCDFCDDEFHESCMAIAPQFVCSTVCVKCMGL